MRVKLCHFAGKRLSYLLFGILTVLLCWEFLFARVNVSLYFQDQSRSIILQMGTNEIKPHQLVASVWNGAVNSSLLHHMPGSKRTQLLDSFSKINILTNASGPTASKHHKHFKNYCDSYQRIATRDRSATTVYDVFSHEVTNANDVFSHDVTNANDVTLVTHLTMSRFFMLRRLVVQWSGPMSVALLVLGSEQDWFWRMMESNVYHPNLMLHVVIDREGYYPGNYLRNVALKRAVTDFVLLGDVDFMPVHGLSQSLKDYISKGLFKPSERKAYIVPAFELLKSGSTPFPRTKEQLLALWRNGKVVPFHQRLKSGHGPTDYKNWKETSDIYKISYKSKYEPYVVVPRCLCPLYYEGLVGRGYNKVAHIWELYKTWFGFFVLPDGFFLHLPHKKVRSSGENYRCSLRAFRKFTHSLRRKKRRVQKSKERNIPNCPL